MNRLKVVIARTRFIAAGTLAWVLLPPAYVVLFVPLRIARRFAGQRDPLGLAFPGPPGSLWRARPPTPGPHGARRMS